jgi:hypothetical protein
VIGGSGFGFGSVFWTGGFWGIGGSWSWSWTGCGSSIDLMQYCSVFCELILELILSLN